MVRLHRVMVTSYYFVNGDCENYIKTLACWMTKTLFKYAYDPNIYSNYNCLWD